MNKWKKAVTIMRVKSAFERAQEVGEAKRVGVELRSQMKSDGHLELSDLSQDAAANAVLTKNYFGEHALMLMCEHGAVTSAHLHNYLSVEGSKEMAKDRRREGDFPLHYLCQNQQLEPRVLAGCLEAFLTHVPQAAKWRGKWGLLPMHCLCSNPSVSSAAVRSLFHRYPGAIDEADGKGNYSIHYLCLLDECSMQADALRAFLACKPSEGTRPMKPSQHRPIDLLARNQKAPSESIEALLLGCPHALEHLKSQAAKGFHDRYLDRIRFVLAGMEAKRRRSLGLPSQQAMEAQALAAQVGPNQHVNTVKPGKRQSAHSSSSGNGLRPDPRIRRSVSVAARQTPSSSSSSSSSSSPKSPSYSAAAAASSAPQSSFLPPIGKHEQHSQHQHHHHQQQQQQQQQSSPRRQRASSLSRLDNVGGGGGGRHGPPRQHRKSALVEENWGMGVIDEAGPSFPRIISSPALKKERRFRRILAEDGRALFEGGHQESPSGGERHARNPSYMAPQPPRRNSKGQRLTRALRRDTV